MGNSKARILTLTLSPCVDEIIETAGEGSVRDVARRRKVPAGKGINAACILGSLGIGCEALGFVGRSEEGWFREELLGRGIRPRLVATAGRTRTNTTVLFPEGGDLHLKEKAPGVTRSEVRRLRETIGRRACKGAWIAFCGSLPEGMTAEDLGDLCALCLSRGAKVLVDGGGAALRAAAKAGASVLKGNAQEVREALGLARLRDPAAAAEMLGGLGAEAAAVTLGAQGAALWRNGRSFRGRCPAARVCSTVGAGDAFTAGMLWGLILQEGPADLLARALAVAAAKIAEGEPGRVRLSEWRAARRRAIVREL